MSKFILGIDPGTTQSGVCLIESLDFAAVSIVRAEKIENAGVRELITRRKRQIQHVICESMAYQGRGFGAESIKTCYEIGRLFELCERLDLSFTLYPRQEYGRFFVPSGTLNDASLRFSLEQIFGPSKKKGDPLYSLRGGSDKRSAFAVAKYHQHVSTCPYLVSRS